MQVGDFRTHSSSHLYIGHGRECSQITYSNSLHFSFRENLFGCVISGEFPFKRHRRHGSITQALASRNKQPSQYGKGKVIRKTLYFQYISREKDSPTYYLHWEGGSHGSPYTNSLWPQTRSVLILSFQKCVLWCKPPGYHGIRCNTK